MSVYGPDLGDAPPVTPHRWLGLLAVGVVGAVCIGIQQIWSGNAAGWGWIAVALTDTVVVTVLVLRRDRHPPRPSGAAPESGS